MTSTSQRPLRSSRLNFAPSRKTEIVIGENGHKRCLNGGKIKRSFVGEKSPTKSTFWHNLEKYAFRVFFEESCEPLRGEWVYIYPWYPRYFKPLPTLWWNPWWAMMNGLAPMQRNTEKWPIFNEILIVWPLKIFSNTLKLKSQDNIVLINIFRKFCIEKI